MSTAPRAVILAAGLGSRLRPITDDRPKCLAPLAGKTLLDRQLAALRAAGIDDITAVVGYCQQAIVQPGLHKVENPRYDSTNMVASLFCAEHLLDGKSDLVMVYGDIVFERRVLETVLATPGDVTIAADRQWRRYWAERMDNPLADAETFKLAADGRVKELGKKPQSYDEIEAQYTGLVRFSAAAHARIRASFHGLDRAARYDGRDVDNMFMTSFLQILIDQGYDVRPAFIENGWLEVDTVTDLELYEGWHRAGTLGRFYDADR
ncbi:MAG: NTP transferase domain-containing protein [Bacteroidales bacterium]